MLGICPHGHDKNIVGCDRGGHCRQCRLDYKKQYYKNNKSKRNTQRQRQRLNKKRKEAREILDKIFANLIEAVRDVRKSKPPGAMWSSFDSWRIPND